MTVNLGKSYPTVFDMLWHEYPDHPEYCINAIVEYLLDPACMSGGGE